MQETAADSLKQYGPLDLERGFELKHYTVWGKTVNMQLVSGFREMPAQKFSFHLLFWRPVQALLLDGSSSQAIFFSLLYFPLYTVITIKTGIKNPESCIYQGKIVLPLSAVSLP